jgi:hypothetical protein
MSLLESIFDKLRNLPPPKLMEVSNYIHTLHPSPEASERRRVALRSTAACMAGEEGVDFERAVRESADRIDTDE